MTSPVHSRRSRAGTVIGILIASSAFLAIAGLTLLPSRRYYMNAPLLCLICGERGLADAILNTALFAPLTFGLRLAGVSLRRTVLAGVTMSFAIELAQVVIPGRDASLGDVFTNSMGSLIGALLANLAPSLLWPSPDRRRQLFRGSLAAALAGVGASAALLHPMPPATRWYGQWTPDLGHFGRYDGKVLHAGLGGIPLPPDEISASREIGVRLFGGDALTIEAVAGREPRRMSPVISIYDELHQEVFVLALEGTDLILRYRTRGGPLKLDLPEVRYSDAMVGIARGDTIRARLWYRSSGWHLQVNDRWLGVRGFSVASGWRYILQAQVEPPRGNAMSALWLTLWLSPVGFWASSRVLIFAAALAAAFLALAPLLLPVVGGPAPVIVGAAAVLTGGALRWLLNGRKRVR